MVVTADNAAQLLAGSTIIWQAAWNGTVFQPVVLTYDDLGDMLYRIDGFNLSGNVIAALIETYTEERPQGTP